LWVQFPPKEFRPPGGSELGGSFLPGVVGTESYILKD